MLKRLLMLLALTAVFAASGCASQAQFLNSNQESAVQTALARGRFDMNCQDATAVVISREVVQPALQGPFVYGIQRAEYTIGVQGCGQRQTYIVICPENGSGCFAAGPGRFHDWR